MSDLEKYIMENREAFSSDEPSRGHSGRFRKLLNSSRRPHRTIRFHHVMQIAASFAIIVAAGVVVVKSNKGSGKVAAVEMPEQYREAQNYYFQQVSSKYDEIESFHFTEKEEKEMLLKELQEMDIYYRQLLTDLQADPGDERVFNALIQHYQLKVLVMDQIIDQLKQLNQLNNSNNEKTGI